MSNDRQMAGKTPVDQAKVAIRHALRRIQEEWNIGYHMGEGTQAFALLTEAASTLFDEPLNNVRRHYSPEPKRKCDTQVLREIRDAWSNYLGRGESQFAAEKFFEKMKAIMKEEA